MKVYLPIFALSLLLLISCSQQPKEKGSQNIAEAEAVEEIHVAESIGVAKSMKKAMPIVSHFHTNAKRIGEDVTAYIKVPELMGEQMVYLQTVKPINEVGEFNHRPELRLAEFVFTTNADEEIKDGGKDYSWDSTCKILTIKGKSAESVDYASIKVTSPKGVNKQYKKYSVQKGDDNCYELFPVGKPKMANPSFIFFHDGHDDLDPENGFKINKTDTLP